MCQRLMQRLFGRWIIYKTEENSVVTPKQLTLFTPPDESIEANCSFPENQETPEASLPSDPDSQRSVTTTLLESSQTASAYLKSHFHLSECEMYDERKDFPAEALNVTFGDSTGLFLNQVNVQLKEPRRTLETRENDDI